MLKKILCISAAALALAVSLTACSTYLEKSGTYDVETGDRVKITVDAKAGYDITLEAPFVISKDDETILNGTFLYSEYLEEYKSAYEAEPTASLVDEGEKDGKEYFCYAVGDEYDYFVKVGDSNTAVILASTASEEEASAAFNSTVISLEEYHLGEGHHHVCRSPRICPCSLIGRTVCQSAAMPTDRCRFESGLGLARSIVLDVRISYGLAVSPPARRNAAGTPITISQPGRTK